MYTCAHSGHGGSRYKSEKHGRNMGGPNAEDTIGSLSRDPQARATYMGERSFKSKTRAVCTNGLCPPCNGFLCPHSLLEGHGEATDRGGTCPLPPKGLCWLPDCRAKATGVQLLSLLLCYRVIAHSAIVAHCTDGKLEVNGKICP